MSGLPNLFAPISQLAPQLKILAGGRLLSGLGSGFTLFYLPIIFVNQVGLSATNVGLGLGAGSLAGIVGRVLGGSWADNPRWGRRCTLLLAVATCGLAALGLAAARDFASFILSNSLMGFGIGLYWPPSEAIVADLAPVQQRQSAYAITRLADNLGLGVGISLGGVLMAATPHYQWLFIIDALSFALFFAIVALTIPETAPATQPPVWWQSWSQALRDIRLLIYVSINVVLTLYISQIHSTLPLYFSNVAPAEQRGFSPLELSALLTWHMLVAILLQLPMAQQLGKLRHSQGLIISSFIWAAGFGLVGLTGIMPSLRIFWAGLSLAVLALATVAYTPAASALVVDLAPPALRGVYLSINSLCWAAGYALGPPLGGWALDQSQPWVHIFWGLLAASTGLVIAGLTILDRILKRPEILSDG